MEEDQEHQLHMPEDFAPTTYTRAWARLPTDLQEKLEDYGCGPTRLGATTLRSAMQDGDQIAEEIIGEVMTLPMRDARTAMPEAELRQSLRTIIDTLPGGRSLAQLGSLAIFAQARNIARGLLSHNA